MKTSQNRDLSPPSRVHQPKRLGSWLFGLVAASLLPWAAFADADAEARYPYDPACAWGRLSNGKGMLHRCLTKEEAHSLARAKPGQLAKKKAADAEDAEKDDAEDDDAEDDASKAEEKDDQAGPVEDYEMTIGPIVAEKGDITIGALDNPRDRYRKCVDDEGGLRGPQAKVIVKFLVRGERRRAEGVEVESFDGVSEEAARCIAYVVDRRRVGTPSVPLTGAELTFEFSSKDR